MFAWRGAWYVLAFVMLEIAVVTLAFFYYARHATDCEHIALIDGCLLIERIEAGKIEQIRLDPHWTRVALPRQSQDLINLEAKGVKIKVGGFVTQAIRQQVAQEIQKELRSALFAQTGR
jgi:uncharacterized membrane protein